MRPATPTASPAQHSWQVTAAQPAPAPVPAGSAWKWDARNATLDPNNATLSAQFLLNGLNGPNLAMTDWAVATADAGSGDPEYSIPRIKAGRVDHRAHPARHQARPLR